ncbi:hypothetical protein [Ottowia beijingensis]|uniref:hypothetical protein n=1 Tax=Ottowia beijingensis TaxID=1207057 RepID=UPI002FDB4EA3
MSLTRAEIDAWKEELRLEGQACTGYTDGVLAALVYITLGCPPITMADLAGFEGPNLWTLAVTAHRKRPHVIETIPDMIPLSRGEHFAVMHGLRRQLSELPVAPDLLGLVEVVYGPLMAKTLRMIAYPLARHMGASQ